MIPRDEWDDEWDAMTHTNFEYRYEIRQLRERCILYWQEIEQLREENRKLRADLRQEKEL